MDYTTLIDAQTWAFIRLSESFYPPESVSFPVADQRRIYDRMCQAFFAGYPDGIDVSDIMANNVTCRLYDPGESDVTVIYFHGGGFVVGGLDSHDDICAEICARTGYRVLSVGYRLAPEHRHPAAFNDCRDATSYAAARFGGTILLAGDSAGGNLAAAVAHQARSTDVAIAGQVLIYPGLGGDPTRGSYIAHANAPMLTLSDLEYYRTLRCADGQEPQGDPTYAPLADADFSDLPPTLIVTAECDPLGDDGADYRDALRAARVQVRWVQESGLVHGYLRARSSSARAGASFDRIVAALAAMGRGEWTADG